MSELPPPVPLTPLQKAARFARLLLRPALARKLGTLVTEGYLQQTGWVRSILTTELVGPDGEARPWMTYPFIDFIGPRLRRELRVFEYGAGASTLFFARRVGQVLSVEHDAAFAATLAPRLPANARVIVHPAGGAAYAQAVRELPDAPHLVIVDGVDREACAAAGQAALAADGVLVLDDSQRPEYDPIRARLHAAGFRALDFWGLAPGRVEHRCTTVFYRNANVLGL